MTNELALLADWSVRQKLNRVSSVKLSSSAEARQRKHQCFPHAECMVAGVCKNRVDRIIRYESLETTVYLDRCRVLL